MELQNLVDYTLEFVDLEFRPGFNTTCRLGTKHYFPLRTLIGEAQVTKVDSIIALKKKDSDEVLYAYLKSVAVYPMFADMDVHALASNHIARDYYGLYNAMKDCYLESFDYDKKVTVIGFDLI